MKRASIYDDIGKVIKGYKAWMDEANEFAKKATEEKCN